MLRNYSIFTRFSKRHLSDYYSDYKKSYEEHAKTLSHINQSGKAVMVDIKDKNVTLRKAKATASVLVGSKVLGLIKANNVQKGDVLSVAKIAGIMGAKKTPDLIPLCHPLDLTKVHIECKMDEFESKIIVECEAKCLGRTGVEMEALTGASIAALTVYDMCKAVNKAIVISDVKCLKKVGVKVVILSQSQVLCQILMIHLIILSNLVTVRNKIIF